MTKAVRTCLIAAGLVAAASLSVPAEANSIRKEGYFGGTWSRIGPSDQRYYRGRYYAGPRFGYGRGYAYDPYYYGPGYSYGPGVAFAGPGFGVGIGIY